MAKPQSIDGSAAMVRQAKAYLAVLNDGGRLKTLAFIESHFSAAARAQALRDPNLIAFGFRKYMIQQAHFVRLDAETPTKGKIIFYSALPKRLQSMSIEIEQAPPYLITKLGLPQDIPGALPQARTDRERVKLINAFARQLSAQDLFSGVVLVARGNDVIFQKAYGLAERRFSVPNTLKTRFQTASITKTFTAVAITQLVEQGKLSWDDPLSKFLPDFPNKEAAKIILLKHLLSHTSGLGDNVFPEHPSNTDMAPYPDHYRRVSDFLSTAPRTPLAFEPGKAQLYSNLGYLLLGRIVEIASGEDYYDYVVDHIFKPAGMLSAGNRPRDDIIADYAYGYDRGPIFLNLFDNRPYQDNTLRLRARSSPYGGAYMTAADLFRFDRALRAGKLISLADWRLISAAKPELGAPRYGFGLDREEFGNVSDRKAVGHGGNTEGACDVWATTEDTAPPYTLIVMSNSGVFACWPVSNYMFSLIQPGKRRAAAAP